jgi:hypothetical protein
VIGLATTGPAVYGEAPEGPGVRGLSEGGPGVRGESVKRQGGVLSSRERAQLHLVPLDLADPNGVVEGEGGDLLATRNRREREVHSLWFCVVTGDAANAVWVKLA